MNDALNRWRMSLLDGPRSNSGSQKSWLFSNAGDVVRRKVAALSGLALAERVVHVPGVAIREPLSERRLQSVVDHRLAAVHVVAARRAERRVRPHAGLSVERLRKLPLQRKVVAIGADVADLRGHRAAQRMLHAHHRLDGVGRLHVGVEDREDASSCPLRLASAMTAVSSVYIGHLTPLEPLRSGCTRS